MSSPESGVKQMTQAEMGENLIALGTLLRDPDATLSAIVEAALACNLRVEFALVAAAPKGEA